ncbi:MAG: DUF6572 domain-containing protein [Terrimicrobiaceae bacterium]|jgi:hypothetical protein
MVPESLTEPPKGVAHPAVLDAFAFDGRRDTLVLAMYETRPWTGAESHLLQLQEKLNAYASFILDGEMRDSFPQFHDKPVEIQLRTAHEPDPLALGLLAQAREQLALQQIHLETIVITDPAPSSCGCGSGGCGNN